MKLLAVLVLVMAAAVVAADDANDNEGKSGNFDTAFAPPGDPTEPRQLAASTEQPHTTLNPTMAAIAAYRKAHGLPSIAEMARNPDPRMAWNMAAPSGMAAPSPYGNMAPSGMAAPDPTGMAAPSPYGNMAPSGMAAPDPAGMAAPSPFGAKSVEPAESAASTEQPHTTLNPTMAAIAAYRKAHGLPSYAEMAAAYARNPDRNRDGSANTAARSPYGNMAPSGMAAPDPRNRDGSANTAARSPYGNMAPSGMAAPDPTGRMAPSRKSVEPTESGDYVSRGKYNTLVAATAGLAGLVVGVAMTAAVAFRCSKGSDASAGHRDDRTIDVEMHDHTIDAEMAQV